MEMCIWRMMEKTDWVGQNK